MKTANKRMVVALAIAIGGALILAVGIALTKPDEKAAAWNAEAEGFLAVATPCCTRPSLWDALDETTPDGQRARPASAAEAAQWLNDWPYRSREDFDSPDEPRLHVAVQNSEVRCTGPAAGDDIPRHDRGEETLKALQHRPECVYTKWKVWSAETADERPNERHTVWADEDGFFHGRVDYWQLP
jgi:hypothetical protein